MHEFSIPYLLQAYLNKSAFQNSPKYREKREILEKISKAFEQAGIKWALSCSAALFFRGIVDGFNDFDILLSKDSMEKAKETLRNLGVVLNESTPQKDDYFCSPDFQQARYGNVEFDLITDISIKTFGKTYTYKIEQGLEMNSLDGNYPLPLIPIEAQLVLYGKMEGWESTRLLKRYWCHQYLLEMKKTQKVLRYHEILKDALEQGMPPTLIEVINSLLK